MPASGLALQHKAVDVAVDGLLDELNVLKTVIDICGTDEDYAVRIADVKHKLKEATA